MITALFTILAVALIVWLIFWFVDWATIPQPFNKIIKVVVMGFALLVCINAILIAFGQPGYMPSLR